MILSLSVLRFKKKKTGCAVDTGDAGDDAPGTPGKRDSGGTFEQWVGLIGAHPKPGG